MQYRVWGQPAAWCDQVICTWISEYLQELYPQGCIQIVDCLGSQWAPDVVLKCWAASQAQIPIAPNATSTLQVADTHVHSPLKAHILCQKTRLQAEYDQIAVANGQERFASWGLQELASVMGEAWTQMMALQADKDLVLHGAIKNQLLAFRPDQEGNLQRIDSIRAPWTDKHPLLPPSQGIKPVTACARIDGAAAWPEGGPPEPDWTKVDQLGTYLHQLQEVPGREEAELDLRLRDLQLTPQQLAMAASPESRLKTLTPVRHGVAAQMESRARIRTAIRHRVLRPGKWATKLSARYKQKFAQEANKKLQAAGSMAALSNTIMPGASGAKALKRKPQKAAWAARKKIGSTAGAGQAQPEVQLTYEMIHDHPFLGAQVRVISPATMPELLGKIAKCQVVQLRKLHKNDPGKQICTIELSTLGPDATYHIPRDELQLLSEEAAFILPAPFRQNLSRFSLTQKQDVRRQLSLPVSSIAEHEIQPVVEGQLLELAQVHAGMLDMQARLDMGDKWATLSPAAAVSFGHSSTLEELQKGSNAEMLAAFQREVSSKTLFSTIVWASGHFTYLDARRASASEPWAVYYQDSLPVESSACHETAAKVARAAGVLPANKPLGHSSEGCQKDGWSCGLRALQLMEVRARLHRGEAPCPPPSLHQTAERLSEWAQRLTNKWALPPLSSRQAKAKAKAKAKAEEGPADLSEALKRAMACTKCRTTTLGQKGCAKCMGEFFFHVRTSPHPTKPHPTPPHPTPAPSLARSFDRSLVRSIVRSRDRSFD